MVIKDIQRAVVMTLLAVTAAFVYNHFSPFGIAVFGQWDTAKGGVSAKSKNAHLGDASKLNQADIVRKMLDNKAGMVIDVRSSQRFDQGHIPGAVNFPLEEFDDNIGRMFSQINRNTSIIVYCSSATCQKSHLFAQRLKKLQYHNVNVFSGGFSGWVEKGHPIQKNEN